MEKEGKHLGRGTGQFPQVRLIFGECTVAVWEACQKCSVDVAMLIQISKCIVHSQCQYFIDENGLNQVEMQKQVGRILHYEIAFSGATLTPWARQGTTPGTVLAQR